MKIVILFLAFCWTLAGSAGATDFNYTGNKAEAEGITGEFIDWFPIPKNGFLGGPGGGGVLGEAQQFTVNQETQLTDLNVGATIIGALHPGTINANFNLYTGSFLSNPKEPVPDPNTLSFTSSPVAYTETLQKFDNGQPTQFNDQVAFNVDLKPGTYWLSEEGTGPAEVQFNSITYDGSVIGNNVAQTPEPPIWIFFTALAGFVLLRRKKYVGIGRLSFLKA